MCRYLKPLELICLLTVVFQEFNLDWFLNFINLVPEACRQCRQLFSTLNKSVFLSNDTISQQVYFEEVPLAIFLIPSFWSPRQLYIKIKGRIINVYHSWSCWFHMYMCLNKGTIIVNKFALEHLNKLCHIPVVKTKTNGQNKVFMVNWKTAHSVDRNKHFNLTLRFNTI